MGDNRPLAVFGLLADIQYADHMTKISAGKMRYYRESLSHIQKAISLWKSHEAECGMNLKFILQLGDPL